MREFLTRQEATYRLGLMDSAQKKEPAGVRVACRDRETGEVFEAEGSEVLHAQIALRVGRAGGRLQDGWTVPEESAVHLVNIVPYETTLCNKPLDSVGESWTDSIFEALDNPVGYCRSCVAVARGIKADYERDNVAWQHEIAIEAGMLHGVEAYNDAYGY